MRPLELHPNVGSDPHIPSFRGRYGVLPPAVVNSVYRAIFAPGRERYLTHGIAVQLRLPEDLRRGTHDIDITDVERTTLAGLRSTFQEDVAATDTEGVLDQYEVLFFGGHHSNIVHICNWFKVDGEDGSAPKHYFDICFTRRSGARNERMRPVYEREFDNREQLSVEGVRIDVADTVDLIARKLIRIQNIIQYEGFKPMPVPEDIYGHWDLIQIRKAHVSRQKEEVTDDDRMSLRVLSDQFDVRALLLFTTIDQNYFELVMRELQERGFDRKRLDQLLAILPEFSLG